MYLVLLVSGPDDGETTYPSYGAFLLAFAATLVFVVCRDLGARQGSAPDGAGRCGRRRGRRHFFIVALEAVDTAGDPIRYWRALFVLVLGLVVAVALVATRIRRPWAHDAATEAAFRAP